jgi:hypothetical protein
MTFSLSLGQDVSNLSTSLAGFPQRNPTRSALSAMAKKKMCSTRAEEITALAVIISSG